MPRILIVDDERNIRSTLARSLRLEGYATTEAANGREALERLGERDVDLVLLDLQMPELDGLEVLERMAQRGERVPAIVLTAHGTVEKAVRAIRLGAVDFIEKPPSTERILVAVAGALRRGELETENRRLAEDAGVGSELLGRSPAMAALRETIARVAPADAGVLIGGESGVGKELVARALHAGSPRARRRFVTVNCAAVPETLVESELFGHARGAFTGATDARRGRFQEADGGTLFLDEVGEIPLAVQPKLLRALEGGEVERVGGGGPERVDARVIAATNRDLAAEVAAGRFRSDLYYRLLVVPIEVPPLRQRLEDLPELAAAFLAQACRRNRLRPRRLAPAALDVLRCHAWPGNVRELRNAIERAAILARGDEIGPEDLAFVAQGPGTPGARDDEAADLATVVERAERTHVLAVLERHRWRMSRAAETLGLERSHLYKKLKALGIERPVED